MKAPIYILPLLSILILTGCQEENVTQKAAKLDYYIESFQIDDLGFEPQSKVMYAYQRSGKIDRYTVLSYNPDTDAMEEQQYFVFPIPTTKLNR